MNCIYKITNLVNNLIYIGRTSNYQRRLKEYKRGSIKLKRSNMYKLMIEMNKYGFENFKFEILEDNLSENEILEREIYWIDKLNTRDSTIGYNSKTGGVGGKMTEETKSKMSESSKSFRHTEEEKLKRSKGILVYHFGGLTEQYDSAKIYADIKGSSRTNVTYAIRSGTRFHGSFVFYQDKTLREATKNKIVQVKENNIHCDRLLMQYIDAYEDLRI
jgi:hypothetical protein